MIAEAKPAYKTKSNNGKGKINYGLRTYLEEIKKVPLLTRAEEIKLSERIKKGDLYARDEMIRANLRLVVRIAKGYAGELMETIENGNLGLLRAVEKYDASLGYKFSTYAYSWIRQGILSGFNGSKLIHVPESARQLVKKINEEVNETGESFVTTCMKKGVSGSKLERLIKAESAMRTKIASDFREEYEKYNLDEEEPLLISERGYEFKPEDALTAFEELEGIDEKTKYVIEHRFGLYGKKRLTLDEIGKKFGMARQRVKQIEQEVLKKLARHMNRAVGVA